MEERRPTSIASIQDVHLSSIPFGNSSGKGPVGVGFGNRVSLDTISLIPTNIKG